MAVIEFKNPSSLKIKLDLGLVDGKTKTRSKTYSNVVATATTQDVFDVANALMGLQNFDVIDVIKQDNTLLAN